MRLLVALSLLLAVALSGCTQFWTGQIDPVTAPGFEATDTDGNRVNLTDFDGPLLIDFMGTWCGPCQRAVPVMHDLQSAYPDLHILSVSGTDTEAQINDFRAQHGAPWPHVSDLDGDIVDTYREAGSRAGSMMWPSYALVIDGNLVFYNRGETLPATFTSVIDSHIGREAPPLSGDVLLPALLAFGLGALAWLNPWLRPIVLETPRRRGARSLLWPMLLFGLLGVVAAWGSRPLTGRVGTLAPFLAVAGIAGVGLWRWKGAKTPSGKRLAGTGLTHEPALHGNLLWYGLPVWGAVLHAALLRTAPWESLLLVAAFGFGVAAMDGAVQRGWDVRLRSMGEHAGWLGALALLIGAAWNGGLYVLR